jgi:hypothetical protein
LGSGSYDWAREGLIKAMAVYCIIASKEAAKLRARVKELYSDAYELPPNAWFVVDTGTTTKVRDKIGLNSEHLGPEGVQGVVILTNGTSGYAPSDIWEWMKSKVESRTND